MPSDTVTMSGINVVFGAGGLRLNTAQEVRLDGDLGEIFDILEQGNCNLVDTATRYA